METAYLFTDHVSASRFYQTARKAGYQVRILGNAVIGDNDAEDILNTHYISIDCYPLWIGTGEEV